MSVVHPCGIASWGDQIDVQILEHSEPTRAKAVAGYVAKYATKSSEGDGALDARIRSEEDLARRHLSPHLRRMAETAWKLGGDPAYGRWRLRRHAHSLGYGGHFLSKSRGTRRPSAPCGLPGSSGRRIVRVRGRNPPTVLRTPGGVPSASAGRTRARRPGPRRNACNEKTRERCGLEEYYSRDQPQMAAIGDGRPVLMSGGTPIEGGSEAAGSSANPHRTECVCGTESG